MYNLSGVLLNKYLVMSVRNKFLAAFELEKHLIGIELVANAQEADSLDCD